MCYIWIGAAQNAPKIKDIYIEQGGRAKCGECIPPTLSYVNGLRRLTYPVTPSLSRFLNSGCSVSSFSRWTQSEWFDTPTKYKPQIASGSGRQWNREIRWFESAVGLGESLLPVASFRMGGVIPCSSMFDNVLQHTCIQMCIFVLTGREHDKRTFGTYPGKCTIKRVRLRCEKLTVVVLVHPYLTFKALHTHQGTCWHLAGCVRLVMIGCSWTRNLLKATPTKNLRSHFSLHPMQIVLAPSWALPRCSAICIASSLRLQKTMRIWMIWLFRWRNSQLLPTSKVKGKERKPLQILRAMVLLLQASAKALWELGLQLLWSARGLQCFLREVASYCSFGSKQSKRMRML